MFCPAHKNENIMEEKEKENLIQVLWVEDDPQITRIYPMEAERYGIELVPFGCWEEAEKALDCWLLQAYQAKIPKLTTFANTLKAHKWGILAWYDYHISTGKLEGINNKIKTMKRLAYGFRDQRFFELKILAMHDKNYAFVG